jgi:hypothetical protein
MSFGPVQARTAIGKSKNEVPYACFRLPPSKNDAEAGK